MNPREQAQMNTTLAGLQKRGDVFTRNMLNAKIQVQTLQQALKDADALIAKNTQRNKKKAIGLLNLHTQTANEAYQRADGLDPTKLADINQKKLVGNLEARLNKALIRHSETVNENNAIKAKINKCRRKRKNDDFNRVALEKKLQMVQDKLDVVMNTAAEASEQRQKATDQKLQIMEQNIDEQNEFNREYNDLSDYIVQENNLLEESISKAAMAVKFDDAIGDVDTRGSLTVDREQEIKNNLATLTRDLDGGEKEIISFDKKIASYKANFDRLRDVSGLQSIDDIVSVFIKNEEETFSLFNFIQTVNQETDHLAEQHARLLKEISTYEEQQISEEQGRVETLERERKKVEDSKEERERMTILAVDEQKTVEKIAKKVQTLFYKIQCDHALEQHGVGNKGGTEREARLASIASQGVSESNILAFMGIIEERAVQIIGEYARTLVASKDGRRPSVIMNTKAFTALNKSGQPNSLEFSDDEFEDDEGAQAKPISIAEFRQQAKESNMGSATKIKKSHQR